MGKKHSKGESGGGMSWLEGKDEKEEEKSREEGTRRFLLNPIQLP